MLGRIVFPSIRTFDPTNAWFQSKILYGKPTLKKRGSLRLKDVSALDNGGICGGHQREKFTFVGSGLWGLPDNTITKSLNQLLERPRDAS
jgi:hypothetical protein